jgi:CubicO group peptidase (beta-lactamase class C family)
MILSAAIVIASMTAAAVNPFPPSKPEAVGLDPAAVKELADRVRLWIEQDDAVGAELLVIKNRRTVLHEAYGLKDLDDREPLTPGTIACIRSMTKPVVGTAVQMLVDEGELAIDDPVAKYLPSFANAKSERVTVRQLLTHTAGFPITIVDRPLTAYQNGRDIADRAGAMGPSLKPDVFSYSDTDTEILASIVGQIAGEPAEAFIQKRILAPLGMTDTYPLLTPGAPDRSRVSSNHAGGPATWHKYWDNQDGPFFPFFLGAAGMYSTTIDYARFLAMWMDRGRGPAGPILSEAAVRRALAPAAAMIARGEAYPTRFPGNVRSAYGQHWTIYDGIPLDAARGTPLSNETPLPVFGHSGSDGTAAWAFPDRDLMVLLFTQSRGGIAVIRAERFVGALAGLTGPPAPTLTALPDGEVQPLLGTYHGPGGYVYAVRQRSRVALQMPEGLTILRWPDPQGRWAFDGSLGSAAAQFTRGPGGTVTGLDLLNVGAQPVHLDRVAAPSGLPRVDEVIRAGTFPEALQLKGTLTIGAREGSFDVTAASGGRFASAVAIATTRERIVLDGRSGWSASAEGTRELRGSFLEQVRLSHPFVRFGDHRGAYVSLTVDRRDTVDGKDVWVIRAASLELPPATLYVSAESGVPVREDSWLVVRGVGVLPYIVRFDDYRAVGPGANLQLPFSITSESVVTGKRLIRYSSITPVTVTDKTFARPD